MQSSKIVLDEKRWLNIISYIQEEKFLEDLNKNRGKILDAYEYGQNFCILEVENVNQIGERWCRGVVSTVGGVWPKILIRAEENLIVPSSTKLRFFGLEWMRQFTG